MKWIVLVAVVGLAACESPEEGARKRRMEEAERIDYIRDDRTGLCYAVLRSPICHAAVVSSLALVPCEKARLQAGGVGE